MPKPSSGIKHSSSKTKTPITDLTTDPTTLVYKEFETVPLPPPPHVKSYDTYDYGFGGDSAETIKWFEDNSNFREILNGATLGEHNALLHFTAGHFMNGQQYQGFSKMSSMDQTYTRSFDTLLDQSVVKTSVILTRASSAEFLFGAGKKTASLEELQAMKGKAVTTQANLSSAAAKVGLAIGAKKQIEYKMHIPAGSKGAGMYIGVKGVHTWGVRQREFMINRDTRWIVGDTKYNSKTKKYEVDVYFDTQLPYDYS